MVLLKYVPKSRIIITLFFLAIVYFFTSIVMEQSDYSFFQHPYITMIMVVGHWYLVFRFNFSNSMFTSRFESIDHKNMQVVFWLSTLSTLYVLLCFAIIIFIGNITGDVFTLEKVFVYLFCSISSFVVLNVLFVALTTRMSELLAKIVMFALLFGGFASNFAGSALVYINFIFFNINTKFTHGTILNFLIVYTIFILGGVLLTFAKENELC